LGDGFEALLTGGIPDLHSDFLSVNQDGLTFEVDSCIDFGCTDRGDVRHHKGVGCELEQDICLAHSGVSDDQQLGQKVILRHPRAK
jgi:hypothetical protein